MDSSLGEEGSGGLLVGPANLVEETDRLENFGVNLAVLQKSCDIFCQGVGRRVF